MPMNPPHTPHTPPTCKRSSQRHWLLRYFPVFRICAPGESTYLRAILVLIFASSWFWIIPMSVFFPSISWGGYGNSVICDVGDMFAHEPFTLSSVGNVEQCGGVVFPQNGTKWHALSVTKPAESHSAQDSTSSPNVVAVLIPSIGLPAVSMLPLAQQLIRQSHVLHVIMVAVSPVDPLLWTERIAQTIQQCTPDAHLSKTNLKHFFISQSSSMLPTWTSAISMQYNSNSNSDMNVNVGGMVVIQPTLGPEHGEEQGFVNGVRLGGLGVLYRFTPYFRLFPPTPTSFIGSLPVISASFGPHVPIPPLVFAHMLEMGWIPFTNPMGNIEATCDKVHQTKEKCLFPVRFLTLDDSSADSSTASRMMTYLNQKFSTRRGQLEEVVILPDGRHSGCVVVDSVLDGDVVDSIVQFMQRHRHSIMILSSGRVSSMKSHTT